MILNGEKVEPSEERVFEDHKSASESKKSVIPQTDQLTELVEHNYAEIVQKAKDREN